MSIKRHFMKHFVIFHGILEISTFNSQISKGTCSGQKIQLHTASDSIFHTLSQVGIHFVSFINLQIKSFKSNHYHKVLVVTRAKTRNKMDHRMWINMKICARVSVHFFWRPSVPLETCKFPDAKEQRLSVFFCTFKSTWVFYVFFVLKSR